MDNQYTSSKNVVAENLNVVDETAFFSWFLKEENRPLFLFKQILNGHSFKDLP